MTQKTSGLLSALSFSRIYDFIQFILRDNRPGYTISDFVSKRVSEDGLKILDVACGTGAVRDVIKLDVEYKGYDISKPYIDTANAKGYENASFIAKEFSEDDSLIYENYFDVAFILGGLHHMSDKVALNLISQIHRSLKPGGYFLTMDPCYIDGQSSLTKFLISLDRGKSVRTPNSYKNLVDKIFTKVDGVIIHRKPIPWTHWAMECKK